MLIQLAWRNIWRNKLRSSIIISAITLGLFAGTFLTAFITGWMTRSVISDIDNQVGYIQVHRSEFAANNDISAWFLRDDVAGKIASTPSVTQCSYRLRLNGMLASAANAAGITVKGVNPEAEKATSTLWQTIPDSCGTYLPDDARMQVVVSRKTADKLKVRLKSKIVLTFQDVDGEMQSLAFRVGGIFKTTNTAFDESTVFVKYSELLPYTGLPEGAVHEAAVMTAGFENCKQLLPLLQENLPGMEVQSWDQVQPELGLMYSWTSLSSLFILVIFLLALSFGIVNTMLMAVLERNHELTMLARIGMNRGRIFRMIMLETLFLTLVGSGIGMLLGVLVIGLTARSGLDLTFMLQDQFEDYGFGSVVYPVMDAGMFGQIVLLVILAGLLSALYPAHKAVRLHS